MALQNHRIEAAIPGLRPVTRAHAAQRRRKLATSSPLCDRQRGGYVCAFGDDPQQSANHDHPGDHIADEGFDGRDDRRRQTGRQLRALCVVSHSYIVR